MQNCHLILLLAILLPACAASPTKTAIWSDEVPAQSYFKEVYAQDNNNNSRQTLEEYLLWVMRFYQGTELYANGWNTITQAILLKNDTPERVAELKDKMERLGFLVSSEWAKDNQTRIITTRHVSIWGNALLKSLELGESLALIDRVTADVEDLLAKRISAEMITEDRFYAEEDVFQYLN
ncbi:hypothetical protein [Methylomonas sp. AM2-LC]|uniref:hypothetical protein n=1 Tax=Methylomonas sp. AM2-LC TaxID=3153301 RepID=UPI003265F32B